MKKRALLSVSDKSGIVELGKFLVSRGWEIVSSGGTYKKLHEAGVAVKAVEECTGEKEILGGRVKTLHPSVHGGILALRNNAEHMQTLEERGIAPIDLVVCNLYPFRETISQPDCTLEKALENVDIGGPAMIRAAAKNYKDVLVIVAPQDYEELMRRIEADELDEEYRKTLAIKAFSHTALYDGEIAKYLEGDNFGETAVLGMAKQMDLRYGENPHQKAVLYCPNGAQKRGIPSAVQLQGKELSYNNINDADAAIRLIAEFSKPAAVAVKHANPCGVAVAEDIVTAYRLAHDADPVSIFGGIVAVNREINAELAKDLTRIFLDVVIAPGVTEEAKKILAEKKKLRVLLMDFVKNDRPEIRSIVGGYLVQEADNVAIDTASWELKSGKAANKKMMQDLLFAWQVAKYVKSNAIVVVKNGVTLGIGGGQVNRIDAARHALKNAGSNAQGAVLASDGLLPFSDVVAAAAEAGVAAIVQPGGSIRDDLSIDAANELDITMYFTGIRHFRH